MRRSDAATAAAAAVVAALLLAGGATLAQTQDRPAVKLEVNPYEGTGVPPAELMRTPVTSLFPNNVTLRPGMKNPYQGDLDAAQRGMKHYEVFNCVGCHAPNGGGGMGPSLSNSKFVYGEEPAQIFLSIYHGRPKGMPAWGDALPEEIIWELVTYIQFISREPPAPWGKTTSRVAPEAPKIEQVPAEYLTTPTPWKFTQPFSKGQRPYKKLHPQKNE